LLANFFELRNKRSFTALAPEGDPLNDTALAATFEYRPACTTNNTNLRAILFSKFCVLSFDLHVLDFYCYKKSRAYIPENCCKTGTRLLTIYLICGILTTEE
jgi:hypothetical protein